MHTIQAHYLYAVLVVDYMLIYIFLYIIFNVYYKCMTFNYRGKRPRLDPLYVTRMPLTIENYEKKALP